MVRIACVWIAHYAAALEQARLATTSSPDPKTLLVVYEGERVLEASTRAAETGVSPGARIESAMARCPKARLVPADRARYQTTWTRILDTLCAHSPIVEDAGWGCAYLEASGMGALYGGEAAWCRALIQEVRESASLSARVAVANSKAAAHWVARTCALDPGYDAATQSDRQRLSRLPVDLLALPNEALRRLHLLGLHTMGQFARISRTAVAEQLGPESLLAHAWVRGDDTRPLEGRKQQVIHLHHDFETPESRREALVETLWSISRETLARLQRHGLVVRRVEMAAERVRGDTLRRSSWVGKHTGPGTFRKVLEQLVDGLGSEGSECHSDLRDHIAGLQLDMIGIAPLVGEQLRLFSHNEGRARLERTLRALIRKHSGHCVLHVQIASRYAPLLSERYVLRELIL